MIPPGGSSCLEGAGRLNGRPRDRQSIRASRSPNTVSGSSWPLSDGSSPMVQLRTEDEVLNEMMYQLGFARRGARIVSVLIAAIRDGRRAQRRSVRQLHRLVLRRRSAVAGCAQHRDRCACGKFAGRGCGDPVTSGRPGIWGSTRGWGPVAGESTQSHGEEDSPRSQPPSVHAVRNPSGPLRAEVLVRALQTL